MSWCSVGFLLFNDLEFVHACTNIYVYPLCCVKFHVTWVRIYRKYMYFNVQNARFKIYNNQCILVSTDALTINNK